MDRRKEKEGGEKGERDGEEARGAEARVGKDGKDEGINDMEGPQKG